jgi:hypothetical protein
MLQKHCVKDEQRTAHRFQQQREKARTARDRSSSSPGRQPLDPTSVAAQRLTDAPDTFYDTDCGSKKVCRWHLRCCVRR